jgi:hypothetical protein
VCLEEPENGIHPERIPAMLSLLRSLATDTTEEIGQDNPLRQVIINTHSPAVVMEVPEDSLLVAESVELVRGGVPYRALSFSHLPDTWRAKTDDKRIVSFGKLLTYLNPVLRKPRPDESNGDPSVRSRRVVDRPEFDQLALFSSEPKK